jgi:CRISPR-associated endoribonuclease Cas6
LKYTKLSIIIDEKPPYFIGSQLRGAFGYALKKVTCINPSFKCDGCFASDNCLYYQFYEEKNTYHKYRFDFELGKGYYEFNFYLFDDAVDKLPYVISAFHMMLTKNGLGKDRKTFDTFEMYINDTSCMQNKNISIPKEYTKEIIIDEIYSDISLQFVTPLRMKKANMFIKKDELSLSDIINSIYKRQMKLLGKEYKKFPYKIEGEIEKRELRFKELTRMSNRQKTTMNLGGLIGKIDIKGLNKESYEVLKVGELIGVGKQTVFGLGKIKVEELDSE